MHDNQQLSPATARHHCSARHGCDDAAVLHDHDAELIAEDLADLERAERDNQKLSRKRRSRPAKPKRARRHREAAEMAQMVTRVTKAMVRRAATGDIEALIALRQMRDDVAAATKLAAQELHDPTQWSGEGYSWTTIAQELGISRQSARQQYSK